MASRPLRVTAAVAAGLMLVTVASAYSRRQHDEGELPSRRAQRAAAEEPTTSGRCAIFHARFGGRRAQLVKVMMGSVPNYVVIDIGKRDPLLQRQRMGWLRATYGDGEQTWLGEYGSPEAAQLRAAKLCPPRVRCWPGDEDCGPRMLTPSQAFLQGW